MTHAFKPHCIVSCRVVMRRAVLCRAAESRYMSCRRYGSSWSPRLTSRSCSPCVMRLRGWTSCCTHSTHCRWEGEGGGTPIVPRVHTMPGLRNTAPLCAWWARHMMCTGTSVYIEPVVVCQSASVFVALSRERTGASGSALCWIKTTGCRLGPALGMLNCMVAAVLTHLLCWLLDGLVGQHSCCRLCWLAGLLCVPGHSAAHRMCLQLEMGAVIGHSSV